MKKNPKSDRVTFRCPAVMRRALEALARADHRSVSDWITLRLSDQLGIKP